MNKDLFIQGYLERLSKKYNLQTNFAFEILVLATFLEIDFDEAFNKASTLVKGSGSNDGGMDGIYFEEDEDNIILHLFQTKNQKNLGDNEISKFYNDYENIFVHGNITGIPLNEKVTLALEKYRSLVFSGRVIDTKLYFVFSGEKNLPNNKQIWERQTASFPDYEVFDLDDLYEKINSLISSYKKRNPIKFTFQAEKSNISLRTDPQAIISFSIQNVKAVSFRFPALDLCQLLDEEIKLNKKIDTAFSENIRGFLRYNRTNKQIKETLLNSYAEYFPFLNNGITIISERIKIPSQMQIGKYPIETLNPVIVNGLQTTNVIYEIYKQDKEKLAGVYVMIRLYETNDTELVDKITDATNTQSPINYRDKISNKEFNKYTKAIFENAGVGYLQKRGDTFENKMSIEMGEFISSEIVLKFWYASFYEKPEFAKSSKSKVLEDLFDATTDKENKLYQFFSGDKDSPVYKQLINVYKLYRIIVSQREAKIIDKYDFVDYADELFAYGIYRLLEQKQILGLINDNAILLQAYEEIFKNINSNVIIEKDKKVSQEQTYSHNSYFKSAKCRIDLNECLNWSERENIVNHLKSLL
jgi:hypothetical protein